MDIVILTPIYLEYSIVRNFLSDIKVKRYNGFTCEVGQFQGIHHNYRIAIRETGARETAAALATQEVIEQLKPSILILLGICGGIKDVKIGDVVVGTKAYGYEAGKETPNGFVARPESYHYDKELIEHIKILLHHSNWKKRSTESQNAIVVFGPIASGNKVIATTESPIYKQLKLHYNDTTAVEMEAAGFAEAAFKHKNVRILNIRGVSDLLDEKSEADAGGSQERAVKSASAFVFEILTNLNPQDWGMSTSSNMPNNNGEFANVFSVKDKAVLEKLITNGSAGEAIHTLREYSPKYDKNIRKQILHLTDRWKEYDRKRRMGLLDAHHLAVERGQILDTLIDLINT